MPKERFHILLADRVFQAAGDRGNPYFCGEHSRNAFLLGSILPDIFFYDLPFRNLSAFGNRLHRFQGESGLQFVHAWIAGNPGAFAPDAGTLILGIACHFLADGLLHPHINRYSNLPIPSCRDFGLSPQACHHWLESELEGYWLQQMGPADGFLPLLKGFGRKTARIARYMYYFREFLVRAGLPGIPTEARIMRCLRWQTFLLRQFARPRWGEWGSWLLASGWLKSLAVLTIPIPSRLCSAEPPPGAEANQVGVLCKREFMEETIIFLASRLCEHPVPS